MTDDIVTRLRNAAWVSPGHDCETNDDRLFREAAAEIERLRADNSDLLNIINLLKKEDYPNGPQ